MPFVKMDWRTEHPCIRCNTRFRNANSVGRWECRYHWGVFDYSKNEWTCCKKRLSHLSGCSRCDHSTCVYSEDNFMLKLTFEYMKELLLSNYEPLAESVVECVTQSTHYRYQDDDGDESAVNLPVNENNYIVLRRTEHDYSAE